MKTLAPRRLESVLLRFVTFISVLALSLALCSGSVGAETTSGATGATGKNAAAQALLVRRLNNALASARIPASQRGAIVVDVTSGETVFSRNATGRLTPASNEKLAIAFSALALLEPGYRIPTAALGEGEQQGAEWSGDLYLKGYGDPDLSTADLKTLALRLRAKGIRSISGDLIGDESFFDSRRMAPGWKSSYLINECPPLSALSVDRGRVTSASPPLIALRTFARKLEAAGVRVSGGLRLGRTPDDAGVLATVQSPQLWKLIRFMDRESDNYSAELLLKQVGASSGDQGTTANGAAAVTDALDNAGVPLAGVRIVDGSGLSRLDRLTPAAIAAILTGVWDDQTLHWAFVSSLAIAGRNGTLAHRMQRKPALGNVRAKTGTTNLSSALSGYVRDRYAFAILQNGNPIPSERARAAQDRFVTLLAAQ
jgi:D-alanyl-D-alanine carboxypeptidase/D-alanyl-D-alanine-endopeptidase (penicillin-binding protein 4)